MIPYLPIAGGGALGPRLLRLPSIHLAARALVVLAAAFAAGALGAGAWLAAGLGVLVFVTAGLAALYLRALNHELVASRQARADWERRYRRLYDCVTVAAFCADRHGRLRSANRGLVALLGYGCEAELVACDFAQHAYVGPGTFEAVLHRARAQGALENLEMRLRRFDGLTVTVLATIQAIWDEAGEVIEFEGMVVDLTRERLAESRRLSMERRFRRLFDSNAVGMLVGNLRRGTLEEANAALIELCGLRPSALPLALEKLIPADQRPLHRAARASLEAHGAAGPLACEYVRAGGARVPVLVSATMVDPQYGDFVAVVVDRTTEAGALRRVEQLQAFCDAMLANPPTPVATFDQSGGLARCNHAFCDWLGVACDPVGQTLPDLLDPTGAVPLATAVARALAGETVEIAVEVARSGRVDGLALTLIPRCSEVGAFAGFVAVVRQRPAAATPVSDRPLTDCAAGRRTA